MKRKEQSTNWADIREDLLSIIVDWPHFDDVGTMTRYGKVVTPVDQRQRLEFLQEIVKTHISSIQEIIDGANESDTA